MATIKPRRGTAAPGTGAITQNELAVDTTNKRIYIGAADGSGILIGSANKLSDFSATTSDELASVISDETGSGLLVFGTSPNFLTSITTTSSSFTLLNTTVTTLTMFASANTINFGKYSGTLNLTNGTINLGSSLGGSPVTFNTVNDVINGESGLTITAGGTLTLTTTSPTIPTCGTTTRPVISLPALNAEELGCFINLNGANVRFGTTTTQGKSGCRTDANILTWVNSNGTTSLTMSNAATTSINIAFPTSAGTLLHTAGGWTVSSNVTFSGDIALNGGDLTTTSATSTLFNSTTTNLSIGGAATTFALGNTATAAQTVNMFTASTGASTYNFATGATTTGITKAVNLGTGGASGSTTNIGIGSANGGTLTLNSPTISIGGNIIDSPTLRKYNEPTSSPAISSNTLTLDLSVAQVFTVSLNSSVTTLTISNTPATSSRSIAFTLILTADGTARTITWPGSVKWASASPPTLTSTNGKIDVFSFVTTDAGTTWLGFVGGQNF
jgi:hypothetical protein